MERKSNRELKIFKTRRTGGELIQERKSNSNLPYYPKNHWTLLYRGRFDSVFRRVFVESPVATSDLRSNDSHVLYIVSCQVCPRFGRAMCSQYETHRIHVWNIYLHEWLIFVVNVGKYTIHGCYGKQNGTIYYIYILYIYYAQ